MVPLSSELRYFESLLDLQSEFVSALKNKLIGKKVKFTQEYIDHINKAKEDEVDSDWIYCDDEASHINENTVMFITLLRVKNSSIYVDVEYENPKSSEWYGFTYRLDRLELIEEE
ncbi:hypothetical protein A4_443 [Escherichia phage A4]|nr:hypothetical protein A4_443 [Escherichia phage A4]